MVRQGMPSRTAGCCRGPVTSRTTTVYRSIRSTRRVCLAARKIVTVGHWRAHSGWRTGRCSRTKQNGCPMEGVGEAWWAALGTFRLAEPSSSTPLILAH